MRVIPVTLVVPMLNEAPTLPELLAAIEKQSLRPAEVLFADSGSQDGGPALIAQWWNSRGWEGGRCEVIANVGGLPGGNRNAGVRRATQPWIAFLDAGIVPADDWLEQLYRSAEPRSTPALSGDCRFDADHAVPLAVCALSAGVGRRAPVLPASLFRREVFNRAGFFREDLRAGEDLEWLQRLAPAGITREYCPGALVHYRHFPATLGAATRKWFVYEKNSVRAGVRQRQKRIYLSAFAGFVGIAAWLPQYAALAVIAYGLLRGGIDPVRRSRDLFWWRRAPAALPLAFLLGPLLDLSKLAATLVSLPAIFARPQR